jgi:anti-sigma28 factor (negative regulator of flagellin synthesis)
MEIGTLGNIVSVYQATAGKPMNKTGGTGKPLNADSLSVSSSNFEKAIEMKKKDISNSVKNYDEEAQIEKIRTAIQNGTYNVSAEDVARALLGY